MPIRYDPDAGAGGTARFEGVCAVDEALPLAEWLEAAAEPRVDLGACTELHTALLQLLLAAGPAVAVAVAPEDAFLRRWVAPLLAKP
ncbi:hypothetical protein [Azospirillum agricola]|uniref:hypothetical protein n=1 Tax=Azospirillum agricola TaxID=1720247 RepID=UPI000A0F1399|nr:hypothetical protein [Azospirillum agricola]SMH33601.1 hypothetical protein SAMN02982994_0699 [Azospirillum lipoferum]